MRWRRSLVALFCLAWLAPPLPAATLDRLERPALESSLAPRSLLLDVARRGELLVAVGERGHILRSTDDGRSWQQARVPLSVTLTAVQLVDADYGWAVGHDGAILASRDGGRSWRRQLDGNQLNRQLVDYYQALQTALEAGERDDVDPELVAMGLDDAQFAAEEGPSKPLLDLYFADRDHGWAVGAYGLLLSTEDGGDHWQPASLALDNPDGFHLNAITGRGDELLIAGEAGVLFRSRDLGRSWERLESGYEGPLFSVTELGERRLLLSGLRGRLFLSDDDGEAWQAIETATRATLNAALALADGGVLAVGNGGAVLYAAPGESFTVRMQPGRRSYTALVETAEGALLLVGQRGVTRTTLSQLLEAGDE